MHLPNELIQKLAESWAQSDPLRVVLCCKALEGLTKDDLRTLIPSYDIWAAEFERQVNAGEGADSPEPGNVRLEQITHLIDALNALIKI